MEPAEAVNKSGTTHEVGRSPLGVMLSDVTHLKVLLSGLDVGRGGGSM